jgi:stress-induced-phosphoprotein 1
MGMGKLFSDPGLMSKLEQHPKTKGYMVDPSFRSRIVALQASGGKQGLQEMMGDPRMLTVLGVIMGIDIVSLPCMVEVLYSKYETRPS